LKRSVTDTVLVVAAVGVSGSGKTVTLEYLISHFSAQGYRIGAVKHIHREGFTIDREGSNTWRYAKAGSKVIMAVSHEEIDIIKKIDAIPNDLDKILDLLKQENLDIVFIEGFHTLVSKRGDIPKIITAKNQAGLEETFKEIVEPILAITGIVAMNAAHTEFENVPIIKIPENGQKLIAVVKKQLKEKKTAN